MYSKDIVIDEKTKEEAEKVLTHFNIDVEAFREDKPWLLKNVIRAMAQFRVLKY